jgi:hypothetical protein
MHDALSSSKKNIRHEAIAWIFIDNPDFTDICFLARYDVAKVRKTVAALLDMTPAKRQFHFRKIKEKSMRHDLQRKKRFEVVLNL